MFLIIDLTFKKKIKYLNPGQCVLISSNAKIYTLQGVTDQHSCKCSAEPSVLYTPFKKYTASPHCVFAK
jgi:hypothetical protein